MKLRQNHPIGGSFLVALFILSVSIAEAVKAQTNQDIVPGEVHFKVPDGYWQSRNSAFRGMFMVAPGRPAGMFVVYPNDRESVERLRQRVLRRVAEMFFYDRERQTVTEVAWHERLLLPHDDDEGGLAMAYLSDEAGKQVQLVVYERAGQRPFLYGYFAMRSKWDRCPDGEFLDEQGQGVKAFAEFRNSFSN